MRKMALDIGDVRIGVATSDPLGVIASGYKTLYRKEIENIYGEVLGICQKESVDTIVIGLPRNMDGTNGNRAEISLKFGEELKKLSGDKIKIVYMDERLTSVQAERILISSGVRRDDRKKVIDKVAATIILETYLNKIS
ncbi:MAG: Holliday junction resolvase RuvX [Clostridiales bacterium]|jgi:putative Holliday junction resolvase|nr:Holliday junction resolvase RuvX [Clostridiales bacterium]